MATFASSLTIEETTSPGPGMSPRRVVLVGPALPFMGAEWGFENALVTTWYPGNGVEGTQQTLGPREMPSAWEGEWNRTRMGSAPSIYRDEAGAEQKIVSPHVLLQVMEAILREGLRLRVTWAVRGTIVAGSPNLGKTGAGQSVNFQIVREGRVKTFKYPIDRHTDIRWSAEFHWVSRGGKQDRALAVRGDSSVEAIANSLVASANATAFFAQASTWKILATRKDVSKSADRFTLGKAEALAGLPSEKVNEYVQALQRNVGTFKKAGEIVLKARDQPEAIVSSVVNFASNTMSIAKNFRDELGRTPPELLTKKTTPSSVLLAAGYFGKIGDAATQDGRQGQSLLDKARQIATSGGLRGERSAREDSAARRGDILAVHVCKTGDTPQTLSMKYYGGPDHGVDILKSNRMPWHTSTFRPGQILIVPALVGTATSASRAT